MDLDFASNQRFKEFIKAFALMMSASSKQPLPQARILCRNFFITPETVYEPVAEIRDLEIQGYDKNPVPLRAFIPEGKGPFPVLLFFHRGGWVFGSIEEADPLCRKIANRLQCTVVACGYRLSPENKFPKALDDCYAALEWVSESAQIISGKNDAIMVGGESAGGNLAAAVALKARNKNHLSIALQLLIYPILDSKINTKNYEECQDQYFLTLDAMKTFWTLYLTSPEEGKNPYASPIKAIDLSNLPPALIITAEYDPLRHEAEEYARMLKKSKVRVMTKRFNKVIHGFLDLPLYEEKQKNNFLDELVQCIKSF